MHHVKLLCKIGTCVETGKLLPVISLQQSKRDVKLTRNAGSLMLSAFDDQLCLMWQLHQQLITFLLKVCDALHLASAAQPSAQC